MRSIIGLIYQINRLRWRVTRPVTVGVRLILTRDQAVLLVKHTYQRQWYLPGGGVKRGETLQEAARREAAEEIGATLGDLQLFGVYTSFYEHKSDHVIVFSSEDLAMTGQGDQEIERFGFFGLHDLPSSVSPGTKRRVHEYVRRDGEPFLGIW